MKACWVSKRVPLALRVGMWKERIGPGKWWGMQDWNNITQLVPHKLIQMCIRINKGHKMPPTLKKNYPYSLPYLELEGQGPSSSPRQASCSNLLPTSACCMQNDIMMVLFKLSSFRKKSTEILLHQKVRKQSSTRVSIVCKWNRTLKRIVHKTVYVCNGVLSFFLNLFSKDESFDHWGYDVAFFGQILNLQIKNKNSLRACVLIIEFKNSC